MIPWYSWSLPGRNPGTSTNVTIGMLNASHVRTNRAAVQPREPRHHVNRPEREDLEEITVVHDAADHLVHVVRLPRRIGDHVREALVVAIGVVDGRERRR